MDQNKQTIQDIPICDQSAIEDSILRGGGIVNHCAMTRAGLANPEFAISDDAWRFAYIRKIIEADFTVTLFERRGTIIYEVSSIYGNKLKTGNSLCEVCPKFAGIMAEKEKANIVHDKFYKDANWPYTIPDCGHDCRIVRMNITSPSIDYKINYDLWRIHYINRIMRAGFAINQFLEFGKLTYEIVSSDGEIRKSVNDLCELCPRWPEVKGEDGNALRLTLEGSHERADKEAE